MLRAFLTFLPVAALLSITPGPATALVVHSAIRGGRRQALFSTAGNSVGILGWALCAAAGVATIVARSAEAFTVLKLVGGAFLIVLGARSLLADRRRRRAGLIDDAQAEAEALTSRGRLSDGRAMREGLLTSVANPKLAVFFVALFPQFLSPHAAVLPAALAMGATVVTLDVAWLGTLAWTVERAGLLLRPRLRRALERISGSVMIGLGVRIAAEAR
jgi:threonine/homoserine/homoserine lactone efflux protein